MGSGRVRQPSGGGSGQQPRRNRRSRKPRRLRLEQLEQRALLTADFLGGDLLAAASSPADDFGPQAAAVLEPYIARVRGRLTENVPASSDGPTNRADVSSVQAGETILLEVLVQDVRDDDGDGEPDLHNFGVYASYLDILYDPDAFAIPSGTANTAPDLPELPFPISFQNAYYHVPIDSGTVLGNLPDSTIFRYVNGPRGDVDTPGLVDRVGSFMDGMSPAGKSELFHFDIPFAVQSVAANDDDVSVRPNQSLRIAVLDNDSLIQGSYTFQLTPPAPPAPGEGSAAETDFLVFGDTGLGTGTDPDSSIAPPERIEFVSPTLNVQNSGTLQLESVTQAGKGSVSINADGTVTYTSHVAGPDVDSFTYTVTDGNGYRQTATVTVQIEPAINLIDSLSANPNPVIKPGALTLTADPVNDPPSAIAGVEFYRGSELLGVDTDGSDGWTWTAGTAGWTLGKYTFYARAQNDSGQWSEMASVDAIVTIQADIAGRLASDGTWRVAESDGSKFDTSLWGVWAPSLAWTNVMVGDFTGDGYDDIAGQTPNGDWWIARSTSSGIVNELWGRWHPGGNWTAMRVGDFNDDGRADIVGRSGIGELWLALSNGNKFVNQQWGIWASTIQWTDIQTGDFTGDGRDDLAGRTSNSGDWWIARSTGTRFVNEHWGRWASTISWTDIQVGDFNGDARMDIAGRTSNNGDWWIARSTGTKFANELWGRWAHTIGWTDIHIGDFDADGRMDVVGRTGNNGDWWLARSTGTRFVNELWGRWASTIGWTEINVGDFTGDGRMDVAGRTSNNGDWWIARSTGTKFANELWGRWPLEDWAQVLVGNFAGPLPPVL